MRRSASGGEVVVSQGMKTHWRVQPHCLPQKHRAHVNGGLGCVRCHCGVDFYVWALYTTNASVTQPTPAIFLMASLLSTVVVWCLWWGVIYAYLGLYRGFLCVLFGGFCMIWFYLAEDTGEIIQLGSSSAQSLVCLHMMVCCATLTVPPFITRFSSINYILIDELRTKHCLVQEISVYTNRQLHQPSIYFGT